LAPEAPVRDEQVRRYARHILLPDVGGLGQTALLVATAKVDVGDPAGLIAASYLAAGGTGTVIAEHAGEPELVTLNTFNPDARILAATPEGARPSTVELPGPPVWWLSSDGDDTALAYWRGGIAATRWMADIATR
jgi:hypothetical protein